MQYILFTIHEQGNGVPGRLNDLLEVMHLMKERAKPPSWIFHSESMMLIPRLSHQHAQSAKSEDLRLFSTTKIPLWFHNLSVL